MAFVTKAYTDHRVGAKNQGVTVQNPTLPEVIDAVQRLNGSQYTEVILSGDQSDLTISGGNEGRYVAFISVNGDQAFYNLINAKGRPDRDLRVVTGGQVGVYPERAVVSLADVQNAATSFFESGEAPALIWEKQE